jgi:methionine-rich copper-binding protein CopC
VASTNGRVVSSRARNSLTVLAAVLAAAAFVVAAPGTAQAHARLLRTSPTAGASLPSAPAEVVLTFDEPPLALGARVEVSGPDGVVVSAGLPRIIEANVHQTLEPDLRPGQYSVAWRVTSDDGHPVSDTFRFTILGSPVTSSAPTPTPTPSTPPSPAAGAAPAALAQQSSGSSAAVLWVGAALIALLIGAALAVARTRRTTQEKP